MASIWQENPCLLLDKEYNYKKIDKHTVEITMNEGEKYFTIGDEMVIDPNFEDYNEVLGKKGCEDTFTGKETWTTYYYDNGKWKFGCETTFIFK